MYTQNIKTNYTPKSRGGVQSPYVKTPDEIQDAHADRRGMNRVLREQQRSPTGKIKSAISNAIGWVQERGAAMNHEMQETPAHERYEHRQGRRREPYDPAGPVFASAPADPFGVGGFSMMGRSPNRSPPPPRRAAPAPKKKRKRRAPPSDYNPRGGSINSPDFWGF